MKSHPMKTKLPPSAHPDTYRFFRADAIAAVRTTAPDASESEAIAIASCALTYFNHVRDLHSYSDFNLLLSMLREEADK